MAGAVSVLLFTVAPLYLVWPSPEILGLTLATGGLWAWATGRPLLSAVLFGAAGYLKPPNLLMAAPLGFDPLLPTAGEPFLGPTFAARLREAVRRGIVMAGTAGLLYGANAAITGELNYQGGVRKTFYDSFPFDAKGTTFDSAGAWMTTNQLGPLVEGRDAAKVTEQSGPARKRAELEESFLWNLGYFWTGRFGGVLGYYFPAVLALGRLPRARPPRPRRLARRRGDRHLVDRVPAPHTRQLVRRRRDGGEPLLPERPPGVPVRPAAPAARSRRGGRPRRRGRRSSRRSSRLPSSTPFGQATTRRAGRGASSRPS